MGQAGIGHELLRIGLSAYDRMIDLDLADLAVDGKLRRRTNNAKSSSSSTSTSPPPSP